MQSTLYFIEHDYHGVEEVIKKTLIKKYGNDIRLLTEEISTPIHDEGENRPLSAKKDAMQQVLTDIKQFQRNLLLELHKNGEFSDKAIREVEKDMDIDELKLNQTISKTE